MGPYAAAIEAMDLRDVRAQDHPSEEDKDYVHSVEAQMVETGIVVMKKAAIRDEEDGENVGGETTHQDLLEHDPTHQEGFA